jgi:hypothetical protein
MIIGIDFDGTVVTNAFPKIGSDIGATPVLKKLVKSGHKLILITMRSDIESPTTTDSDISAIAGNHLTEAVNWFKQHDIPLWGINKNPDQHTWTKSPKPYCHIYIDDAALGCPLVRDPSISEKLYVNWPKVEHMLYRRKILSPL